MAGYLMPTDPLAGGIPSMDAGPLTPRRAMDPGKYGAGFLAPDLLRGPNTGVNYVGNGYATQLGAFDLGAAMVPRSGTHPLIGSGPLRPNTNMVPSQYGSGYLAPDPGNYWFDRIWILSSLGVPIRSIAFGNIVSTVSAVVTVWNAYRNTQTLSALDFNPALGAFILGVVPRTFPSLDKTTYTVQVPISGPPTIDANVAWVFGAESPFLHITATIVVALAFRPNWEQRIEESLEWMTDVLTGWDGTEQRIRLRASPRRRWRYTPALQAHQTKQLEAIIWALQPTTYACPVWPDATRLQALLASGSSSVPVPSGTTGTDWLAGGIGLLIDGDDGAASYLSGATSAEVLQVSTVASLSVSLFTPTSRIWPIGSVLVPARFMRMGPQTTLERITDNILTVNLDMEEVDTDTVQATPTGIVIYDGDPTWPIEQNRRDPGEDEYERTWDRLDPQTGLWVIDPRTNRPNIKRSRKFTISGRSGIKALREWVYYLSGRLRTVWLVSDQSDIDHIGAVGGASLTIRSLSWTSYYGLHAQHRDLAITDTRDGSVRYARITATVAGSPGQEVLTIAPTFTSIPEAFARVQVAQRSRLEADRVTLRWETDSVVEATVSFRSL